MVAHSHAASLAQIDLTVEGPGNCTPVSYSQRQITLTATKNVVAIGRASKVSAKGFVPAEDNAWFDSAVMSRDHAEISVDMDEKKVQVRDKGSLHGTYLNECEKLEKEPRELKAGDRLTFGLPVERGTSRFMPVSVKVDVSFDNLAISIGDDCGTSTFQVPDDSDYSSDFDSYTSDNSVHSTNSVTMNPKTSSTVQYSLPPKPVLVVDVIDLTAAPTSNQNHTWARTANQASYGNSGPTFIDLSSPPSSPFQVRERGGSEYTPYGAPVTNDVEVIQLGIPNVNVVPVRQVSIHEISSLGAATSRLAELASTLGQTAQALEAIEPSVLDSDMDSNYSSDHSIDSEHHDNDSELSDAENNLDYPEDSDSSSDDDSDNGSDDNIDGQSDHSSDLNEDLESLKNYSDNDSYVSDDEGVIGDVDMFDFPPAPSPLLLSHSMEGPNPVRKNTLLVASDEHDDTLNNPISDFASLVPPVTLKKDETVTKNTSPIAIEKLLNDRPGVVRPTILHPLPELRRDNSPKPWPILGEGDFEPLGVKTGKVDFFAAREENKAYFNKGFAPAFNKAALDNQTTSRPASSVYALCNEPIRPRFETKQDPTERPRADLQVLSKLPPFSQEAPSSHMENHSISFDALGRLPSCSTYAEFEANTIEEDVETKEPATEKPETEKPGAEKSVAQDLETKESEAGKPKVQEVTVQKAKVQPVSESNNTKLPVQAEQVKSVIAKRKRKAEDMSRQTIADRKWGESRKSTTIEAPKADEVTAATTEAESQVGGVSMQLSRTFERPTKRLRLFRLAERVGIAAIGGAMVMGTLIYTAPTFA